MLKFQEASNILKVCYALSKCPHFHRAYLIRVPFLTGIAVYAQNSYILRNSPFLNDEWFTFTCLSIVWKFSTQINWSITLRNCIFYLWTDSALGDPQIIRGQDFGRFYQIPFPLGGPVYLIKLINWPLSEDHEPLPPFGPRNFLIPPFSTLIFDLSRD